VAGETLGLGGSELGREWGWGEVARRWTERAQRLAGRGLWDGRADPAKGWAVPAKLWGSPEGEPGHSSRGLDLSTRLLGTPQRGAGGLQRSAGLAQQTFRSPL